MELSKKDLPHRPFIRGASTLLKTQSVVSANFMILCGTKSRSSGTSILRMCLLPFFTLHRKVATSVEVLSYTTFLRYRARASCTASRMTLNFASLITIPVLLQKVAWSRGVPSSSRMSLTFKFVTWYCNCNCNCNFENEGFFTIFFGLRMIC